MERKITIIETTTQKKSVLNSNATTLGELKAELDAANINYTDMTFYEGLSKVELRTNDSMLPHDIPWKGSITNDLVFMLTYNNKKIASGKSRLDLYEEIKEYSLQEECINRYGKNFTRCSNVELESLINLTELYKSQAKQEEVYSVTPSKPSLEDRFELLQKDFTTLLNFLLASDFISQEEVNSLHTVSNTKPALEIYSDAEIQEMFKDLL